MNIKVKVFDPEAEFYMPTYASEGASGFDLTSVEDVVVNPGAWYGVKTNLSVEIPIGYEMQVRPRSGMALKNGITVLNTPGTVDADYRGEVKVIIHNESAEPFQILKGMRIAQGVIAPVIRANLTVESVLSKTERGAGGFGSTGTN